MFVLCVVHRRLRRHHHFRYCATILARASRQFPINILFSLFIGDFRLENDARPLHHSPEARRTGAVNRRSIFKRTHTQIRKDKR